MKKRNLIAFCVVLVLVCNFLGVAQTGAWFVSGGNFTENKYDTAQVVYLPALQSEAGYDAGIPKYGCLLQGTPAENNDPNAIVYLVPGDSMISASNGTTKYPNVLSLENFSNVPTNVQLRIDVTFDNTVIGADGTETPDEVTAKERFQWRQSQANTYEYGVHSILADGNEGSFMPLLQVTFANVGAGGTLLPDEYKDLTNTNMAYQWALSGNAWNLTLADGGQEIPPISGNTKQFYNVITDFKVVAETFDPSSQDDFDAFFSAHYAGHEISINVKYYAKQIAGEWSLFDNQEISVATQMELSRKQANTIN